MLVSRLVRLVLFGVATLADDRICYFPDGTVSSIDVPCASSGNTHCCARGTGICLDNGFCLDVAQPFGLSRSSCTDRNWGSTCASHCFGENDFPGLGARVARWRQNQSLVGSPWLYCCNGAMFNNPYDTACVDGQPPFALPSASMIYGYAALADAAVVSATSTAGSTSASITGSTSSSTAGSTSPSTSAAGTGGPASSSTSTTNGVAIGVGVGVPLGLMALAGVGWALWERKQRAMSRVAPIPPSGSSSMGDSHLQPIKYYDSQPHIDPRQAELPTEQQYAELADYRT